MPMLRTPAFSEICSPSPASSSGTPAVTAPSTSEVEEGFGEEALHQLSSARCAVALVGIFDERQQRSSRTATTTRVKKFGTPSRRAALSPPIDSTENRKTKAIEAKPLKRARKTSGITVEAVGRVPVRPDVALHAQNLDRTGEAGERRRDREDGDRQAAAPAGRHGWRRAGWRRRRAASGRRPCGS